MVLRLWWISGFVQSTIIFSEKEHIHFVFQRKQSSEETEASGMLKEIAKRLQEHTPEKL